jgi:hypothetical protein
VTDVARAKKKSVRVKRGMAQWVPELKKHPTTKTTRKTRKK